MAGWKGFGKLHRKIYLLTGGRIGGRLAGHPMAIVDTIGRKTGQVRSTPIACYAYSTDCSQKEQRSQKEQSSQKENSFQKESYSGKENNSRKENIFREENGFSEKNYSQQKEKVPANIIAPTDVIAVVASNNGGDADPAWLLNIRANPAVHVQIGKQRYAALAEELTLAERNAFWPRVVALNPPQATHQSHTSRLLPIVVFRKIAPVR